jgi:beta-ureidopropionase
MEKNKYSRRNFIRKTGLTTGLAAASPLLAANKIVPDVAGRKLPREVWIASVSQMDLHFRTPDLMLEAIISILNEVFVYKPDIICLPEVFATSNSDLEMKLTEKEALSQQVLKQFSGIARENNCYLICPAYTAEAGKIFNSAVVFNREGERMGEYRKIHTTIDEMEEGVTPGPLDLPVFSTDFGKIGIQICFDALWDDGWSGLQEKGAEIVFWPSAYPGGKTINTKAFRHKYLLVSSTNKGTARICDISGEVISQTGYWDKNFVCAPVNLEKVFLPTWPFVEHFDAIRVKYGRKVKITTFHDEEWSILESLTPDIFVTDLMKEFNLRTHEQHKSDSELAQIAGRKK